MHGDLFCAQVAVQGTDLQLCSGCIMVGLCCGLFPMDFCEH